jgi:hypothetical protein
MRKAVICEPVGRQGGMFRDKSAARQGVAALAALSERA